jgi:hypothetical protein
MVNGASSGATDLCSGACERADMDMGECGVPRVCSRNKRSGAATAAAAARGAAAAVEAGNKQASSRRGDGRAEQHTLWERVVAVSARGGQWRAQAICAVPARAKARDTRARRVLRREERTRAGAGARGGRAGTGRRPRRAKRLAGRA